jgi:hypothetical protein
MNRQRRSVGLVLIVGSALWLSACASVQQPWYETQQYRWYYATSKLKPLWWYYWTGIDAAHARARTGAGSRVAIVDTGILFPEDPARANLEPGVELCSGRAGRAEDKTNGHGTELAGIVGGRVAPANVTKAVAPNATLIPYKVVCGTANAAVVYRGVERAVTASPRPDVVLLALGPWPGDTDTNGNGVDDLLDLVVGAHPGTLFVVASVWDATYFKRPAWTTRPNVILVAAMTTVTIRDGQTTRDVEVPFNEKRGDIWAPGRDIETASIDRSPSARPYDEPYLMQGTSAAAAIVAGCAALIKEATTHTGTQLRQDVLEASEEAGLPTGRRLKCSKKTS